MTPKELLTLFIQLSVQAVMILTTGLTLYYKLKLQTDVNTKDIKDILASIHDMRNNGFAEKRDLDRVEAEVMELRPMKHRVPTLEQAVTTLTDIMRQRSQ